MQSTNCALSTVFGSWPEALRCLLASVEQCAMFRGSLSRWGMHCLSILWVLIFWPVIFGQSVWGMQTAHTQCAQAEADCGRWHLTEG